MKELSVAVVGSGRWAKALTTLLKHNQNKQRGHIRRVIEYAPKEHASPELLPVARHAQADDATMMRMSSEALAELGVAKPRGEPLAESEDATMMALTADALAAVAASAGAKLPKSSLRADSDDATMMHLTADRVPSGGAPAAVETTAQKDVGSADLIFLAVPAATVRTALRQLRSVLRPQQMLVHFIDGFYPAEPDSDEQATLISSIIRQETPLTRIGALAGPALPEDLEEWSPAALVCGSATELVANAARQVLGCKTLRIYCSSDLPGVEVAAATSCIVALGAGICDAQQLGLSVRAMLVARAAAELSRLGTHLGGSERTFLGLAGFGALMLASEASDGADFQLGRLIGSGVKATKAQAQLGRPCASVAAVRDATELAHQHGLRTPILSTLHRLLFEEAATSAAIPDLLADPNYSE
jgi:glycerol-3-phosphate dehydrogenase (NAD(P)+)